MPLAEEARRLAPSMLRGEVPGRSQETSLNQEEDPRRELDLAVTLISDLQGPNCKKTLPAV